MRSHDLLSYTVCRLCYAYTSVSNLIYSLSLKVHMYLYVF